MHITRILRTAVLGIAVLVPVLTGCQASGRSGQVSPLPSAAASDPLESGNARHPEAVALFKANCTGCHGADLQGRMGPSSSLVKAGARRSAEQIAKQIANGGGGMLPFQDKLTEAEIRSLAEWLSELR